MLEPNRNYVIEENGSIHKMLFCGDSDWEERPTTSIQEIRNKSIDEFAERLKDFIAKNVEDEMSDDLCCEIFQSEIDEIAEEMKGKSV